MQLTQAILPVAGLGTRFLPWTKVVPKELLPIGNEPIIAKLVDECLDAGIDDICFVISPGKELIPQYFSEDPALETILAERGKSDALSRLRAYDQVRFHVVYQHEQLGDGHAIAQAQHWATSAQVAVLFGDDLIVGERTGLSQLVHAVQHVPEEQRSTCAMLCLQDIPREQTASYGIVVPASQNTDRLVAIEGLVEKPQPDEAPSTLSIVGKYIVPQSVLQALPHITSGHGGEIRLIDAFIAQKQDGLPLYGWQFEGTRFDTGSPDGYRATVSALG